MKKIDFYEKQKTLHNTIQKAIVALFDDAGVSEVSLNDNENKTWVVISLDGAESTQELEVTSVKCEYGLVFVWIAMYNVWAACNFAGVVSTDSLVNVYNSVYDQLGQKYK